YVRLFATRSYHHGEQQPHLVGSRPEALLGLRAEPGVQGAEPRRQLIHRATLPLVVSPQHGQPRCPALGATEEFTCSQRNGNWGVTQSFYSAPEASRFVDARTRPGHHSATTKGTDGDGTLRCSPTRSPVPLVGVGAPRPETADLAALPEAGGQVSAGGRAPRESWNRRRLLFQTVPLACLAGGAAMVLLSAAIYLGSDRLRNFDPALIGYATATVFLALGATYRFVLWVAKPPARRYFLQGWQASLRWSTLARSPTLVP